MFSKPNSIEPWNKHLEIGRNFTRSFEDRKSLISRSILHLFTITVDRGERRKSDTDSMVTLALNLQCHLYRDC